MPVVYHAYGDESGIQQGALYCVVAGYVGEPQEWEGFEADWRHVLKHAHVEAFHAKEFFRRDDKGRRVGPYREWNDYQANQFLQTLCTAILTHNIVPVSSAFDVQAFNALTKNQRRWFTGAHIEGREGNYRFRSSGAPSKPYYAALMWFIVQVLDAVEPDASIHFRLDQQNVLEAWGHKVFGRLKEYGMQGEGLPALESIEYHSSKARVELQAADLLAHGWYSFCQNMLWGLAITPERMTAMQMLTNQSKKHLLSMLDASNIPSAYSALTPGQIAFLEEGD